MKALQELLPTGYRFRNAWLPDSINTTALVWPRAVHDGQALTLGGAQKRTTADGLKGIGTAATWLYLPANAIQNGQAALHVTIRFRPNVNFTVGTATAYLTQKFDGVNNYFAAYLSTGDGKLHFVQYVGGVQQFDLASVTTNWLAGTSYIVTFSFTDAPSQRLLVNGVLENSSAVVGAGNTPAGGDVFFMNNVNGGPFGFNGVFSWIVMGVGATAAVALTAAEEQDLAKGYPPPTAKVQYLYLLDEGMPNGTGICYNRGSGGNITQRGADITWAFGGCKQSVFSLDGVNDYAVTGAANVNLNNSWTVVWAGKWKSTYNALSRDTVLLAFNDGVQNTMILAYDPAVGGFKFIAYGTAMGQVNHLHVKTIGSYGIYRMSHDGVNTLSLYYNGVLVGSQTGVVGAMAGTLSQLWAGSFVTLALGDVSAPLFIAIIDGALPASQGRALDRELDQRLGMGIGI